MQEIFKDIIGYEGLYRVSNLGRVKSLDRIVKRSDGQKRNLKGCYLKAAIDNVGYFSIGLCKNGKNKTYRTHVLVSMSFLNHVSSGYRLVVDHINNIKTDNRLENLQLISHRANTNKDRGTGYSNFIGVYLDKKTKKWYAQIYVNKKNKHLGYFSTEEEASEAYKTELKHILF